MRQLIVIESLSLDGILETDADSLAVEAQRTTTAYLFGRRTYEAMAAYWTQQPAGEMADHLAETPKYVISKTLSWPKWANTQVLGGTVTSAVNSLKARGEGNVAVLGSGQLVEELIAENLVDGWRLYLHPVLLGGGQRLFRDMKTPRRLRLLDCRATPSGLVVLNYSSR